MSLNSNLQQGPPPFDMFCVLVHCGKASESPVQCARLTQFNPSSVNSSRMGSCRWQPNFIGALFFVHCLYTHSGVLKSGARVLRAGAVKGLQPSWTCPLSFFGRTQLRWAYLSYNAEIRKAPTQTLIPEELLDVTQPRRHFRLVLRVLPLGACAMACLGLQA